MIIPITTKLAAAPAVLPLAAHEHETPQGIMMWIPPLYDVVLSLIVFILLAVVFYKFALPKINAMLDERAKLIEEGLANARAAQEELAASQAHREAELNLARQEAAKIREQAQSDAKKIVESAKQEAREEAARIAENSARQIEAERVTAQNELRQDVGTLATALAEKIVGESLQDTGIAERVIDRFLADLDESTMAATGDK